MLRSAIFIFIFLFTANLFSQNPEPDFSWNDTTYHLVSLKENPESKKIIQVNIGEKAIIYLDKDLARKMTLRDMNDYNKKRRSAILKEIDSRSKKKDTIVMSQYLDNFEYIISDLLKEGNAKVYYKKHKSFVTSISHRLEKYGLYAHRFIYLPDRRPFFSEMEVSGILEPGKHFSDPKELTKPGEKLADLNNE